MPEITIASGAGLGCAENQTRNLRSNQNTSGTGRAQGSAMFISCSGTVCGMGAIACGGAPNTVARSAAESARPVAGSAFDDNALGLTGATTVTAKSKLENARTLCGHLIWIS